MSLEEYKTLICVQLAAQKCGDEDLEDKACSRMDRIWMQMTERERGRAEEYIESLKLMNDA